MRYHAVNWESGGHIDPVFTQTNMYKFYQALVTFYQANDVTALLGDDVLRRLQRGELGLNFQDMQASWALATLLSLLEVKHNMAFFAAAGVQFEIDQANEVYVVDEGSGMAAIVPGKRSIFHDNYRVPMGTAMRGDIQKGDILRTSVRRVILNRPEYGGLCIARQAIAFHPSVSFPTMRVVDFDAKKDVKMGLMVDFFDGLEQLCGEVLALSGVQQALIMDSYTSNISLESVGCANDRIRGAIEKTRLLLSCIQSGRVSAEVLQDLVIPVLSALVDRRFSLVGKQRIEQALNGFEYETRTGYVMLEDTADSRRGFWSFVVSLGLEWGVLEEGQVAGFTNWLAPPVAGAAAAAGGAGPAQAGVFAERYPGGQLGEDSNNNDGPPSKRAP